MAWCQHINSMCVTSHKHDNLSVWIVQDLPTVVAPLWKRVWTGIGLLLWHHEGPTKWAPPLVFCPDTPHRHIPEAQRAEQTRALISAEARPCDITSSSHESFWVSFDRWLMQLVLVCFDKNNNVNWKQRLQCDSDRPLCLLNRAA